MPVVFFKDISLKIHSFETFQFLLYPLSKFSKVLENKILSWFLGNLHFGLTPNSLWNLILMLSQTFTENFSN